MKGFVGKICGWPEAPILYLYPHSQLRFRHLILLPVVAATRVPICTHETAATYGDLLPEDRIGEMCGKIGKEGLGSLPIS